jgi:exodeoxyribonuclease V beta subunit
MSEKAVHELIDFNRHGVIEASAGTGKTYTIEKLVTRLLASESDISIGNLLVVTFTEKATGELKQRIRSELVSLLEVDDLPGRERIRHAVDHFDENQIATIHGFCNRILNEYAFENGQPFDMELVDDARLIDLRLPGIMRREWKKLYGPYLDSQLRLSGFSGGSDSILQCIAKTAARLNSDQVLLVPQAVCDPALAQAEWSGWMELAGKILAAVKPLLTGNGSLLEQYQSLSRYEQKPQKYLASNQVSSRIEKMLQPLMDYCDGKADPFSLLDKTVVIRNAKFNINTVEHTFDEYGYSLLGKLKTMKGHEGFNPGVEHESLGELVNRMQEIWDESIIPFIETGSLLKARFIANSARLLHDDMVEYKKGKLLTSYDDMLYSLYQSLLDSPSLVTRLQARYRYALVDEFQDTDSVQWKIFELLFLESKNNRLFLIGDPKQAIYRFRGADIYTYFNACNRISNLNGSRQPYRLDTCYRTVQPLLSLFNTLFRDSEWFGEENHETTTTISYTPVASPGEDHTGFRLPAERKHCNIINSTGEMGAGDAGALTMEAIAREIRRLLTPGQGPHIKPRGAKEYRPVNAGDIAVIVRSGSGGRMVESYLANAGIPVSYYKKEGLYQSTEAVQLNILIQALASPADTSLFKRALLTAFFRVPLQQLQPAVSDLESSPDYSRFLSWVDLADRGKWATMFHRVLYESQLFHPNPDTPISDRSVTNYHHLVELLVERAQVSGWSIEQLAAWFLQQLESGESSDENLHRLETELPAVQVLTIHKSKGLEFPIVFVFAGFTSFGKSPMFLEYHDDNQAPVLDLLKSPHNQDRHDRESREEDLRLYYVLLTRAICMIYLPMYEPSPRTTPGPLATFIRGAFERGGFAHESTLVQPVEHYIEENGSGLTVGEIPGTGSDTVAGDERESIKSEKHYIPGASRGLLLESFSSLHARDKTATYEHLDIEDLLDEQPGPVDLVLDDSAGSRLPGGSETGTMIHTVLEHLDFSIADNTELFNALFTGSDSAVDLARTSRDIEPFSKIMETVQAWTAVHTTGRDNELALRGYVSEILAKTLRKTITLPGSSGDNDQTIRLAELEHPLKEVDFFMAMDTLPGELPLQASGYLNGSIDCVFRTGGVYYCIDWKSNNLGSGGYSGPGFIAAVEQEYSLQRTIYSIAMLQWLEQALPGFDPERDFGGMFYLYLRGIEYDGDGGVCFHKPVESELHESGNNLRSRINRLTGYRYGEKQ